VPDGEDRAAERLWRALPAAARPALEHDLPLTEAQMLARHLAFWADALDSLIPDRQPRIELSVFGDRVLAERLADTVRPALGGRAALVADNPHRSHGRGYYTGVALRITADHGTIELADGGLTTWTAQLTQDAKERCLVSCVATERLTALAADGGELP